MIRAPLFLGAWLVVTASAFGADPAPPGWLVMHDAFRPAELARSFANDKLRDTLAYAETGPVRAFDFDLDGDGRPERFIVGNEALCGSGGCPFALLDGKTRREIGSFFGTLILLARHENGWSVVQTMTKSDQGMTQLTTYSFRLAQYQPDDSALIDEVALDTLVATLGRKF